ncbi:hypothetical protein TNCV_3799471 [Trichonephila clavipes]|nr:hypothetical protein TNCV_3799471 [Trichonephila clavipes]
MTLAHKSATILLMGKVCYVICPSAPPDHPGLTPLENKFVFHIVLKLELSVVQLISGRIHYIRGSLNSVADHLSRCINNITIALPDSKDLIKMQHEDPVLSPIIQKIDQNDVSPQVSNYFINGEGLLCICPSAPPDHPGLTPLENKFVFHIVLKLELSVVQLISGRMLLYQSTLISSQSLD